MIPALNVDKLRLDMGEYVLSVQSLRRRSGRRPMLDGVDIDLKRGTFTALVGPAGAGKSLTLACIAGARKPDRGRIRFCGYEIRGQAEERLVRMGIARTHQSAQLFSGMTVHETVTVAALLRRPRATPAKAHARDVLALTGLEAQAATPVDLLDAVGRRQLEIARALGTDPQLLLLDDVTAGLATTDMAMLAHILETLRARGLTMLAATRAIDHHLAPLVDAVVDIDRGKTAGTGAHAAVDLRA